MFAVAIQRFAGVRYHAAELKVGLVTVSVSSPRRIDRQQPLHNSH
ncbi:hypothetical protein LMG26846_01655 [Achromobacter insuavis]|nr:hypothetical protein LMG26846_01655 [Achromobacter insuavis]